MRPRLVVVGDALLDRDWIGLARRFSPDGPVPVIDDPNEVVRAGGALLAATAAADRADVVAITALGRDGAADELRSLLAVDGIRLIDLGLDGPTPEKVRVRSGTYTVARIDRAAQPAAVGGWTDDARSALAAADGVLVADYGRGLARRADVRRALGAAAAAVPLTWDPHRAGPRPVRGTDLATPNMDEARIALGDSRVDGANASGLAAAADLADRLRAQWRCSVAVTAGPLGAAISTGSGPVEVVPTVAASGDPCGAGDHLAAAYTVARATGSDCTSALRAGVAAASDHVAGHVAGVSRLQSTRAVDVAQRTRRAGGTVVAAGGCFDILHAGHVSLLSQARTLGDCLVVCLNGDRSVRRLKGPGRPVNAVADRAAVLLGLGCVDAVEIFHEDTPTEALMRVQPHLFVKGSDYGGALLPEEPVLATWGGRVVLVALVGGRSTTRIIQRAAGASA
jgi:D-beta-D-heptose 7-phosphate kinase/D-beta-D-heptose 1-phosphate adenosyltransferase